MITYDRYNWPAIVCSYRGTAVSRAAGRILLMTLYAVAVQAAFTAEASFIGLAPKTIFGLDPAVHAVVGSLLGFLVVFRMNASNSRYWEGRSHWGQIINASRNLARVGVGTHAKTAPSWPTSLPALALLFATRCRATTMLC